MPDVKIQFSYPGQSKLLTVRGVTDFTLPLLRKRSGSILLDPGVFLISVHLGRGNSSIIKLEQIMHDRRAIPWKVTYLHRVVTFSGFLMSSEHAERYTKNIAIKVNGEVKEAEVIEDGEQD